MNADPIAIIEIIRAAEQGRSGPYICRGADESLYYVKGRNTGRRSQIAEWLCAHLAKLLKLPLPPFSLVVIPPDLVAETPSAMQEVGAGLAFGSREYPRALWFEQEQISMASDRLKKDILVFDWWVHNSDRLTHNSNLLWDAVRGQLVVIDHNMAFDPAFSAKEFFNYHIFSQWAGEVFQDLVEQAEYQSRLLNALAVLDSAIDSIPEDWWWVDDEHTVATDFDLEAVRAILQRCELENFWRMV